MPRIKLLKKIGPAVLPRIGPWLVRRLGSTWKLSIAGYPIPVGDRTQGVLFCFWHGDLLVPMYAYRGNGTVVLVSGHRDGQMLEKILTNLGFHTVSGSITRGGAMALRGLLSSARKGANLCVPPDGPKGPMQKVKKGVLYLASRSGLPVVPAAAAASSAWHARSWDRMQIPKPFARVVLYQGEPMHVPGDLEGPALDEWARKLEDALHAANAGAQAAVASAKHDARDDYRERRAERGHVAGDTSPSART